MISQITFQSFCQFFGSWSFVPGGLRKLKGSSDTQSRKWETIDQLPLWNSMTKLSRLFLQWESSTFLALIKNFSRRPLYSFFGSTCIHWIHMSRVDSRTRHTWIVFAVILCSERFSPGVNFFFLYPRTNSSFDWIYLICCLLWKFRTLELGFFTLTLEKGNDDNYTYCCSALLYTSIKSIALRRIKTLALEVTIFSPLISDSLIQESKKFEQVELVNVQQTDGTSIPAILLEMYPLSV